MTTLYDLNALTVHGYQLRTGDNTTASASVTAALYEAELLMQEELRRELPYKSRTETMVIRDKHGRVYPKAWPVVSCATNVIDGRTLVGGTVTFTQWLGLIDDFDGERYVTPRASITYFGGFDDGTNATPLPITLAHAIYDLARALATDASPVPVGATSVSVGDVSVSYGSASGSAGVDALVPGLSARVAKYKNRWV